MYNVMYSDALLHILHLLWLQVNSIVTFLLYVMYNNVLMASVRDDKYYSDIVTTGEFGVVYRGHLVDWKGTKPTELVAVKTLKEGKRYIQCSS